METDVRVNLNLTLLAALLSALALVVSLVTAVEVLQEDNVQVEQRLVCLELPGPNDCGLDGR